ncbi:MAG: hypothetical protein LC797_21300, partial [Chloroflexi bacterium]|nr:hypothetical protein [Chloroflexota bacterium]
FSARTLVSGTSPLCSNTYGLPTPQGPCNANQFSQPFTGPDGALYVLYSNYNNPLGSLRGDDGHGENATGVGGLAPTAPAPSAPPPAKSENWNQILLSKSTDGGTSFGLPVMVAAYYDLPDCATYQDGKDSGRACVPEKGYTSDSYFRATNYGSGSVNPTNPAQVVVAFGSYINRDSNEDRPHRCLPLGINPNTGGNLFEGVKTAGACNNKILVSVSDNAGATFTGTPGIGTRGDPRNLPTVNQAPRQQGTDQWFQWADFTRDGRLAVSYYDRQYGEDEMTGYSDFSISGTRDLSDAMNPHFGTRRVTTSPMPPPTQFGGVFWGDYTSLTAPDKAYPIWSDTRNPELIVCPGAAKPGVPPRLCETSAAPTDLNASRANDQDVFTRGVQIPLPQAHPDNTSESENADGG